MVGSIGGDAIRRRIRTSRLFAARWGFAKKSCVSHNAGLELIICANLLPESRLSPLLDESDELIAIIVKSIATAKSGKQKS